MAIEAVWAAIFVVLLASRLAPGQQPVPSAEAVITRQTSLGKYRLDHPPDQVYHSLDGEHVAYVVRTDHGARVFLTA